MGLKLSFVVVHLAAICVGGLPAAKAHVALVRSERSSGPISPFPPDSREGLLVTKLILLEHHFEPDGLVSAKTKGDGHGPEMHFGADRMNPKEHNYGPAYANYLSELADSLMRGLSVPVSPGQSHAQSSEHHEDGSFPEEKNGAGYRQISQRRNHPVYATYLTKLASTESLESLSPTIVEVGILTGSGLAMWNGLFPKSRIYGFDIDTGPYLQHVASYKKLGFDDASTQVQLMDQRVDNSRMFAESFGTAKANIVIDDGDHCPECTMSVFHSISNSLADKFVYFVEDVNQDRARDYLHLMSEDDFLQACHTCEIQHIPSVGSDKDEGIAESQGMIVISRL